MQAGLSHNVNLDGGIAAGVVHITGVDLGDSHFDLKLLQVARLALCVKASEILLDEV
jgi:hypothetical protein